MRFQKRLSGLLIPAGLLVPAACSAAAGAQFLATALLPSFYMEVLAAFWGVAAAAMFYYAVRMILDSQKEEVYKELTNSFIYVFVGFSIIACAAAFAAAFGIPGVINPLALSTGVLSIIDFIITMSAGIFVLILTVMGIHMISTQGESGNFDKWRKVLVANCLGVVLMFVAYFIVHAVSDVNELIIVEEMRGLALFMLQIIGFVCVVALIVAGIMLIVSIDESLKDRAKRIVIGTLISLVIVIICYTLIAVFVPITPVNI